MGRSRGAGARIAVNLLVGLALLALVMAAGIDWPPASAPAEARGAPCAGWSFCPPAP
ncbi:MAG: hypothetical protein U0531_04500 [Dehalococcoidia bacterium]